MPPWDEFVKFLISLLVIVNPVGAIPVFLALTEDQAPDQKMRCARVASVVVTLVAAIWGGEPLLRFFGIDLPVFRVGGGILILAAIAVEFVSQGFAELFPALAQRG